MVSNMILVFAFMSMLVFISAKPTYEKASEGREPTTEVVARRLAQTMVGNCTLKQFTYSTAVCQKDFFLSFRKDKSTTCGQRYQRYTKCHAKELTKCIEKLISQKELKSVLANFTNSLNEFKKMHCGVGELDMSKYLKDIPEMKDCPKGTIENVGKCAKGWYQMYKEDKGDSELCKEYRRYTLCAKSAIKRCKFDFTKISWMFKKDLNPFCDKDQIKGQGLD